jgi:hypothetical protein
MYYDAMNEKQIEHALHSPELRERYPELTEPSERTKKAIAIFKEIAREASERGREVVFMSGLAVDAHFGYLTRDHRDVDLMALGDAISDIKSFLESNGHVITDPGVRGESFKVDPTDPNHPTWSHGDLHLYHKDEKNNVVIPHDGKELKFNASIEEMTEELTFLGERARFLKPQYLLEEKVGWNDQVGFRGTEENEVKNQKEIEKIKFLIENEKTQ